MPTSNGLFFQVLETPVLELVGWTVRVLDYRDFVTPVAIINQFRELTIGLELNAAGAGSITLDEDSPFWSQTLLNGAAASTLKDHEYLFECYEDGVLRFQFLGEKVDEDELAEDETRVVTISGPGAAAVLRWAKVNPNAPGTTAAQVSAWTHYPVNWTTMRIWYDQLYRAQHRGTIPFVSMTFTPWVDSAGERWEIVQQPPDPGSILAVTFIDPGHGMDLLDLLDEYTGQDFDKQEAMRAEWFMWPNFKLDVRKTIGTHREREVVFYEGTMLSRSRSRMREEIANYVVTMDEGGFSSIAVNSVSRSAWLQREYVQTSDTRADEVSKRTAIGQITLAQRKDEMSSWTITVPYDQPGRRVFRDFGIGDHVGIGVYANNTTTVTAYRVLAITVQVSGDEQHPSLELTLQSLQDELQRQLQKQMTKVLNTYTVDPSVGKTLPIYTGSQVEHYWGHVSPHGPVWVPRSHVGGGVSTPTGIPGPAGGYEGVRVFIQPELPAEAVTGDIWIDTDG